jgi:hypothetical protein
MKTNESSNKSGRYFDIYPLDSTNNVVIRVTQHIKSDDFTIAKSYVQWPSSMIVMSNEDIRLFAKALSLAADISDKWNEDIGKKYWKENDFLKWFN